MVGWYLAKKVLLDVYLFRNTVLENVVNKLEKFLVYPEKALLNTKITKFDLNLGKI